MRRARIGIIGCGWWATEAHLPALARNTDAVIAGLADSDLENLDRAARLFIPEATFQDPEEMFQSLELDAAIIAVPHAHHFALARSALDHGLHVLIEKPMTLTPQDAASLVEQARDQRREIIVGYPWNYSAHSQRLRKELRAGTIGPIEVVACTYASRSRILYQGATEPAAGYSHTPPRKGTYSDPSIAGGGQGQTQTTHALALVLYLTQMDIARLQCINANWDLMIDVANGVVFESRDGAIGSIMSTGSVLKEAATVFDVQMFGKEGQIILRLEDGFACIQTRAKSLELPTLPRSERYPWWRPTDNLVKICLGSSENCAPGDLGRDVVELTWAMYRSAAEHCAVELSTNAPDESARSG